MSELLLFPLLWMLVCAIIGQISGWQALAGYYRAERPFAGPQWSFQSGRMRWGMGYNNCLIVGADAQGLSLAVFFLFGVGHPPLFIRWDDITVGSRTFLFMRTCRLEFRAVSGVSLTIREGLAEKLRAEAGAAWPRERVEPT